jgi:hypothetical protein
MAKGPRNLSELTRQARANRVILVWVDDIPVTCIVAAGEVVTPDDIEEMRREIRVLRKAGVIRDRRAPADRGHADRAEGGPARARARRGRLVPGPYARQASKATPP